MFFSSSNMPAAAPQPLGVKDEWGVSNEQARPLPYVAGMQRLALTWISDVFNESATAVSQSFGKGGNITTGYNYYASIAGAVCGGPVDFIAAIWLNGEKIWPNDNENEVLSPQILRGTESYVDITIPEHGVFRLYWGTETQEADTLLLEDNFRLDENNEVAEFEHPAYRGVCYAVLNNFFLGFNQTNVQNVEVAVGRYPSRSWMTPPDESWELADGLRYVHDCNPIAVAADWLQNPRFGLAFPDEWLDLTAMNDALKRCAFDPIYLSLLLNREEPVRELLLRLAEHMDAWPLLSAAGVFSFRLIRTNADETDNAPLVTEAELTSRPTLDSESWEEAASEVRVTFNNAVKAFNPDAVTVPCPAARRFSNGAASPVTLDRPWITSPEIADAVASAAARVRANPATRGRLRLLRIGTWFDDLSPGALFRLQVTGRDFSGLIFRVDERSLSEPDEPSFEVSFHADWHHLYPPPVRAGGADNDLVPSPTAVPAPSPVCPHVTVLELPPALCPDGDPSVAVLCDRPSSESVAFDVWLKRNYDFTWPSGAAEEQATYVRLGSSVKFPLRAVILEEFVAARRCIDDAGGLLVQLDDASVVLDEQTPFDGMAGEWLVFAGSEIFSVWGWELESLGQYRLQVIRRRFATLPQTHAIGAEAWLVRRSELAVFTHPHFQPGHTAVIKVSPRTAKTAADLAYVDERSLSVAGQAFRCSAPANLAVGGRLSGAFYETGDGITITWTPADTTAESESVRRRTTVLSFYDGETLLASVDAAAGSSSHVLTNGELVALLGSETAFTLSAATRIETGLHTVLSPSVQLQVALL